MDQKKTLFFTFGNHMHWVDMQWLWGYGVLPGSVADMARLVDETGARGNVNFDGVGYEKMAADCPEALAQLRSLIEQGLVEPAGASYGQPYGLFQGGESNIRQFTYGGRATQRTLGVRPRVFWEEEFYFYPQLPQVLVQSGYTGANLFFQWTWHTPELPNEAASLVTWRGIDGSTLPALPRNGLNVHQWPEDFDGLLDGELVESLDLPVVNQWLELMPTRDWMCRSEVLLPRLKELIGDPRFDVRPATCSQIIESLSGRVAAPERYYGPDDVWHGMTLSKNADRHPRASAECEDLILAAEAAASVAGYFGRPYPSWDVYPTWELDEAWRETLSAQHHDNHECEGLCGFVGYASFERAKYLAGEVLDRTLGAIAGRRGGPVAFNPLGWAQEVVVDVPGRGRRVVRVPAFGVVSLDAAEGREPARAGVRSDEKSVTLSRDGAEVTVDRATGAITALSGPGGTGASSEFPLLEWSAGIGGVRVRSRASSVEETHAGDDPGVRIEWELVDDSGGSRGSFGGTVRLSPLGAGVDVELDGLEGLPRLDPGYGGALRTAIRPSGGLGRIIADTPLAVDAVRGGGPARRKYPSGDWMTSDQWFEEVRGSITARSFVDLLADDRDDASGLLVMHNGSQQLFRDEDRVDLLVHAYDPWDEDRAEVDPSLPVRVRFEAHGVLTHAERVRRAEAMRRPVRVSRVARGRADGTIPDVFSMVEVEGAPGVTATALARESAHAGENLPDWAGHAMAAESDGASTHPFVLRLVEWNGEDATAGVLVAGEVASASKTNLLGEAGPGSGLAVERCEPPSWARGLSLAWSRVRVPLRGREIATVMLDIVPARKQWRDLDAKREVWATIHKTEGTGAKP